VAGWATALSAGPADESGQTLSFTVTGNTNPTLFSAEPAVSPSGTLTYTPAANANGTATVTLTLSDNGGTANGGVDTSASQTFTITVTAVNDIPSFTKGADVTVNEDSGAYSATAWATAISAGPADESSQTLTFTATNDNTALFSAQPALDSSGTLTFTPAANANGSATVTVTLKDDGGTANGGVDTSGSQTFTITVTAVNDAPVAVADAYNTDEDTTLIVATPGVLANAISAGPADERADLTFTVTNDNTALFSAQYARFERHETFTPAADANGSTTVTNHAEGQLRRADRELRGRPHIGIGDRHHHRHTGERRPELHQGRRRDRPRGRCGPECGWVGHRTQRRPGR
jgi:hypothetical protein